MIMSHKKAKCESWDKKKQMRCSLCSSVDAFGDGSVVLFGAARPVESPGRVAPVRRAVRLSVPPGSLAL